MKKYKMVAVDLDGTLLTDDKKILDSTVIKIREMVKQGYIFTFSSGRPRFMVKNLIQRLNVDIPLILYNGSLITFSNSDKVISKVILKEDISKRIISLIESINNEYIFFSNEELFVSTLKNRTVNYINNFHGNYHLIDKENIEIPYNNITKIIWFDSEENLKKYQLEYKDYFIGTNYFTSNPTYLEFVDNNVDKDFGIDKISEYFKISKDEVIAIGDGYNDLKMIKNAGLGVAMKNANQDIKNIAKYVTKNDNNHDGVGEVIDKFIFKEKV